MAEVITNSTPGVNFRGTKDVSGNRATGAAEALAFHRPLHFFFSPQGDTTPQYLSTAQFADFYGADALDVNSAFATHSTPFLNEAIAAVSRFVSIRVLPEDCPGKSNLGLSIDYLDGPVPEYKRKADGSYDLDPSGNRQPTGGTVPGRISKFVVAPVGTDEEGSLLGRRKAGEGSMVAEDGVTKSVLMPLLDFEALDFGDGSKFGFRLWAPTTSSAIPADADKEEELGTRLYRFQFMKRADELASPSAVPTTYDETSILFSFKENVVDKDAGNTIYDLNERIPARWTDDAIDTMQRPPIGTVHYYQANLEAYLAKVQEYESAFSDTMPVGTPEETLHQMNFISAQTVDGVPYHSLIVQGVLNGAVALSANTTHYLQGGGTGTMTNESFNKAVNKILTDVDGVYRLSNLARYPFNALWDTGFDMDTKLLFPKMLSARPDCWIGLSTQDISKPANDEATDESIALSLMTRLQQFPDSVEFNTQSFRGLIAGHSALWVGAQRKIPCVQAIDLYRKFCDWGKDPTGRLNEDSAPDNGDNRIVKRTKNISNLDMSYRVRRRQWMAGICYVEDYDTRSQFYSGIQSFYPDQTSVLRSALVGLCVANINRYAWEVWRSYTGNQNLTDVQLVERSEKQIAARIAANIPNGRMIAKPHAEITRLDADNGYSWTLRTDIGVSGMRTVLNASVVAYRREELEDNG
jgi:hypothetical protein